MAGEVIIVGFSSGPVWGVPDTSWGKGQSYELNHTGEKGELKDGAGRTVALAYYDTRAELSYNVAITGDPSELKRGKLLTIQDPMTGQTLAHARLEEYKYVGSNSAFAEYQLTVVCYENVADASYSMSDLSLSV